MVNSVNNNGIPTSYSGVNINCYTLDPTKLPPDSPLLHSPQPQCTISPAGFPGGGCCYPGNYYINNYGLNGGVPTYPMQPNLYPQQPQNTKKKRVQVLTDQYIKNLEAYLNSPSEDLRKTAAQEVLKRLDEDRTRYNDAALNALINKMLQDPSCHKVKATALTALDTQLAQGNDNTVKILTDMVQNDKSRNGADAATAASILVKMSSPTKLVDVPINGNSSSSGIIE